MPASGPAKEWRDAERDYADWVVGEGTLPEMFESAADRYGSAPAQRYKGGAYDRSLTPHPVARAPDGAFAAISYAEMRGIVRNLAAGFRAVGLDPGDRVGIYADTRMEWALADFALLAAGGVVTTVYTESSRRQVRYLLEDPGATGVVVENDELLADVLAVEDDLTPEFVVVVDGTTDREDVYTLADVHDLGSERFDVATYEGWLEARDPGDLASLIYTSGTTGQPRGVRLTHRNFRANVGQCRKRMGPRPDEGSLPVLDERPTTISLLPLAHVFERLAGHFLMFASGATVGYAESPDTVAEDIRLLCPTHATSVPRVYERILDAIRERATGFEEPILEWALDVAREYTRTDSPGVGLRVRHAAADALVYSTVREQLGGNVEFMVSGGGSLQEDLARIFLGMGVPIVEGYGLTETAPVVSVNPVEDIRPGTMGPPLPGVDVRVDESVVPDGQFPAASGTVGELLVDGPNVTGGYWNRPDETERAFTDDGYLRTGDLVELTADGYLVYTDRLEELIVLSTGKNVAPVPVEDRFATSDRVDQAMVLGDERKFVGALVVPDFAAIDRWADREGVDLPERRDEQVRDDRVQKWVSEAVEAVNADLERSEQIKRFELVSREWTAEADLLTPSLKKKRRNIREAHADAIERIYDDPDRRREHE
jgi:long-chain acyl-CoA synthetase